MGMVGDCCGPCQHFSGDNGKKMAPRRSVKGSRPAHFPFFDHDLCRGACLGVEVDEHPVRKDYSQAKALFVDVRDRFAFHCLELHNPFYLRSDHSFEIVLLVRRCSKSATADF